MINTSRWPPAVQPRLRWWHITIYVKRIFILVSPRPIYTARLDESNIIITGLCWTTLLSLLATTFRYGPKKHHADKLLMSTVLIRYKLMAHVHGNTGVDIFQELYFPIFTLPATPSHRVFLLFDTFSLCQFIPASPSRRSHSLPLFANIILIVIISF